MEAVTSTSPTTLTCRKKSTLQSSNIKCYLKIKLETCTKQDKLSQLYDPSVRLTGSRLEGTVKNLA